MPKAWKYYSKAGWKSIKMPKAWQIYVTTMWFKAASSNIFYNHYNPSGLKIQHLIRIIDQSWSITYFWNQAGAKSVFTIELSYGFVTLFAYKCRDGGCLKNKMIKNEK